MGNALCLKVSDLILNISIYDHLISLISVICLHCEIGYNEQNCEQQNGNALKDHNANRMIQWGGVCSPTHNFITF
jgi:hypothetical protein